MLLNGKPVMNIPVQLEQSLLAKRVARLKAGVGAASQDGAACVKALHYLLQNRAALERNAQTFAAKYRSVDPNERIRSLVDELEQQAM